MDDFDTVWAIYPRRVAKAHAKKMWARLNEQQRFAVMQALPVHLRYWKAAGREAERIPHFGTWLNGERWEDELEMPANTSGNDWMKSAGGIESKAREVGLTPRAGETHDQLRARILLAKAPA